MPAIFAEFAFATAEEEVERKIPQETVVSDNSERIKII
jgi:hypothetical protein